jgi:hypothetical protein
MANDDSTGGVNVAKEVAEMRQMTIGQLRDKYAEVFGESTRARHKEHLIRKIAWRMQANAEGGLSERALRRARELANDADLRMTAPKPRKQTTAAPTDDRLPAAGNVITREYKGRILQVNIETNGFVFEGVRYKSLSAVARAITGSHCNGYLFFRLGKYGGQK